MTQRPAMAHPAKLWLYSLARGLGLFALARRLTARRVRILAYHGFATADEAHFRPKLFIEPATFERRLAALRRGGYRVIPLDQAVQDLAAGRVAPQTVVITIDDGFASTLSIAAPALRRHGFPATVYLTSYHMQTQTPVFDLLVAYLLWKADRREVRVTLPCADPATLHLDLRSAGSRDEAAQRLIAAGRSLSSESDRMGLGRALADALGVDFTAALASGVFRLMTADEARDAQRLGVAIGLHTHRHRFPPDDFDVCRRELDDNRDYLRRELGVEPQHFCYPSGVYSPRQWPLLERAGVRSAMTCDTGLATRQHSPMGLPRFLDGEMVSQIEFEAELSGFAELLRRALRVNRRSTGVVA